MSVRFVNNFSAALAAGIASDATELSFASGVGDIFRDKLGSPLSTDHVYLTIYNSGGDVEYVKVTETSGDDFTVVRGQDSSTARAWLADDMVACRPIAAALEEAVSLPTDLAHSGINLDITELRGLTTPLSVEQGGTGTTTGSVPAGMVMHYAANSVPSGWLKANGSAVSRTTYAALFAAIGTTFGVGDGSTTFTLPDLRGEFIRGYHDGDSADPDYATRTFGSAQADEYEAHTHLAVGSDPGSYASMGSVTAVGSRNGDGVTQSSGGSETRPRNIALLACIKY